MFFSQKKFFLYLEKWFFLAPRFLFLILFGLSPQNFFLKVPALIFSQKSFSFFYEMEISYIFLRKVFLIFRERYIEHPAIFISRTIFRTLAYLELEAPSEPWYIQNSRHTQNTVKHLRWKVLQKQLPRALSGFNPQNSFLKKPTLKNFLLFGKRNFLIFPEMELSSLIFLLYFRK